jgi:hypothetical protein
MSILSRLFGRKPTPTSRGMLCDWMQSNLSKGLLAEEIGSHIISCPICSPTVAASQRARGTGAGLNVPTDKVPTALIIGLEGPIDLPSLLRAAKQEDREVIALGNRSPAFTDVNVLAREMSRFTDDLSLVLIFEKWPSRNDPFCLDPLIIVRRSFFLETGPSLTAITAGELAFALAGAARGQKKNIGFV